MVQKFVLSGGHTWSGKKSKGGVVMAKLTPEEFQEKHARRLKGALEDIRRGVERLKESPTKKAAAKIDKMKERWLKAVEEGKVQRGLEGVGLEEWKDKFLNKGVPRIPAGIDGARDKVIKFASKLLPHIDAGKAKLEKMPDVTLEDSINRASEWIRHMAKFKK